MALCRPMFSGIIQSIGTVESVTPFDGGDRQIAIRSDAIDSWHLQNGSSVCVNGACLSVVTLAGNLFSFDVSNESLNCTNLGKLTNGTKVNLEPALRAETALDGHIVSGHVDAITTLVAIVEDGRSTKLNFSAPRPLYQYIAPKGAICIDGVSLTVNEVTDEEFSVNIIPHTLTHTIFGSYNIGHEVNIEVDIIARYVARLLHNN